MNKEFIIMSTSFEELKMPSMASIALKLVRSFEVNAEVMFLKSAGVMAVGVVFLAEIAVQAAFFADNLYHHDG